MKARLLYVLVIVPLGMLGRPLWRRRLGLSFSRTTESYWRSRRGGSVGADELRRHA